MAKQYKGIDISLYDGEPDFEKVQNAGIDFVIIKASQGRTPSYANHFADPMFVKNIKSFAKTKGKFYAGTYHYMTSKTVADAIKEAKFYIKTISPYREYIQLWAAVDVEEAYYKTLGKSLVTQIVKAFCDTVKAAGFRPMVYSTKYWTQTYFSLPEGVPFWQALWTDSNKFPAGARVWQKGSAAVDGVRNGAPKTDYDLAYGIMGDANGDGEVNAKDVTAAMKHIINPKKYLINESQMDFDRDGKVTAKDVTALMKAIM